jgi:hypothetical protein
MIHPPRGRLGRVVVAASLLGGASTALAALSPQANASSSATKTVKFSIHCTVAGTTYTLPASITGTYPASVKSGKKFTATKVHGYIQVTQALASASAALGNSYKGHISQIDALSSDAKPATLNAVAPKGLNIGGPINGKPFKLPIPEKGSIPSVGPWTAGKPGSDKISLGNSLAMLQYYRNGVKTTPASASCPQNTPPTLLATIKVT